MRLLRMSFVLFAFLSGLAAAIWLGPTHPGFAGAIIGIELLAIAATLVVTR